MAKKTHIGWVVLNKDGVPHRPIIKGYRTTQAPKLYRHEGHANRMARKIEGRIKEVFYEG